MTEGRIRKVLGKDPQHSGKLRDKISYEATMHRLAREGF
jgi:hypothetical protein